MSGHGGPMALDEALERARGAYVAELDRVVLTDLTAG